MMRLQLGKLSLNDRLCWHLCSPGISAALAALQPWQLWGGWAWSEETGCSVVGLAWWADGNHSCFNFLTV